MKIRTIFLALLIVAALVSTGSLTAFAASGVNQIEEVISESSSGELLDSAANNLKDMAIGIRDALDSQMDNQCEKVHTWAQSPVLQKAVKTAKIYNENSLHEKWADQAPENDISPEASNYLADVVGSTLFTEIVVTDARGYVVAASGATDAFDYSGEEWYSKAYDAPTGMYVDATATDAQDDFCGMNIIYTIKDRLTSEYLGQVKAVFDYGTFIDGFVSTNSLLVWEIKVIEDSGNIVATSMIDKTKVNNDETTQSGMDYFAGINAGKTTGFSSASEIDENGEEVYYGFAASEGVNGHIVVVSKKAYSVNAPIAAYVDGLQENITTKSADIQKNMWLMGGVVAVLIVMAAFFVIRAKVSNPLNKLTDVSNKLSVGDIDGLELDVSGKDEIGKLGDSFQGVLAAFNLLRDQAEAKEKTETREPVTR